MKAEEWTDANRIEELEHRATSSNELLSDKEQLLLRNLIIGAEGYIKYLEEDILRPVIDLQTCRVEALCRIERLRTGTAIHRKVPSEILLEIFMESIGVSRVYLPPSRMHSIWSLMQVCSRWRQIILSAPVFWKEIQVLDSRKQESLNVLIHDIFSHRGGGCLISYQPPFIANEHIWNDFLDLIKTHPERLKHIEFVFGDYSPSFIHDTLPITLNQLELIWIVLQSRGIYNGHPPSMNFFKSKSIREATIFTQDQCLKPGWLDHISLPWSQLTELTIDSITTTALIPVLRECAILVECTVMIQWHEYSQATPGEPQIHLDYLQSLTFLPPAGSRSIQSLIDLLTVPALKTLSFKDKNLNESLAESINRTIVRSRCSPDLLNSGTIGI
ncbi:hypothetical protein BDZ94DRAFT_1264735 [Collybia nuda]|uniref:F-box domain-containing protein n=1 Tax=Collybia nuda TaxID=64659 RepID=A0A9P5Y4I0_9AGAR|nr:hypothetical protein BDZ94DRAFT_1264735 [Collybia nuda]